MHRLSLSKTVVILAAVNLVAAVFVVASFLFYQSSQNEVISAHANKYRSYLLADELRQSSDDLTRLGRTYVTTTDAKYEKQYFDILDIRNGKKPRPQAYHRIYWDFFTVDMKKPRADGETISLNEMMKQAGFTEEEFGYLSQAQANSDGLVGLEVKAMNAVKGKFADKDGKYTVTGKPDLKMARTLVHSESYHRYKAQIMAPLDKFFVALESRTGAAVHNAETKSSLYGAIAIVAIILMILVGGVTLWVVRGRVVNALVQLKEKMVSLSENDLEVEIPNTDRGDEIGEMASSVQVFKDNMIRTFQLSAEKEKEQEAKLKRTETIETRTRAFESAVTQSLESVGDAANRLTGSAEAMSATAEKTGLKATTVAAAAEEASVNVQTVSTATEELSSSVQEVGRQVETSSNVAREAVAEAERINTQMVQLADGAQKIGDVLTLIDDIAAQTNLLALNATIEAARAGEAGKGFAVVASEVKSLAEQTAKATDEITGQINAIQTETKSAVEAIRGIGETIGTISETAQSIAAAVEEQGMATQEIASNTTQVSNGTRDVSENILEVNDAVKDTGTQSSQVLAAAGELTELSSELRIEVDGFLSDIRAA